MGLTYELRAGARLITVTGDDVVHVRDGLRLAAVLESLEHDGRLAPGTHMLVDLRRAILLATYQGMIQLCTRFRAHHARWLSRTALLAGGDLTYAFAHQYATLAQRLGMPVAAFRTPEEAHGWLELAPSTS